jgi:hypothetical protein
MSTRTQGRRRCGRPVTAGTLHRLVLTRQHSHPTRTRRCQRPVRWHLPVAREIGIKRAALDGQIHQLEHATGTTLLRTGPDGIIALTTDGEQSARDVRPMLGPLAQLLNGEHGNHETSR